jgi:uncharacterized membrane protein
MKKKTFIFTGILFIAATLMSFTYTKKIVNDLAPQQMKFEIPSEVKTIINNKCFDCHNSTSKNKKGKMKLNFDNLSALKIHKLIGKLDNIYETVEEGEMPPKKAIAKYPDLKLTSEEIETIKNWVNKEIKTLSGE